ncbi:YwqI/YxiC family protein [Paraliobacillus sp. JSM ZJ581]|uniref:YwqI/YxiC family protein n=1 Tax=Paraliobacillus sp. JSM ZJ581 TaxID=3342118 RepID=UPI0035A84D80
MFVTFNKSSSGGKEIKLPFYLFKSQLDQAIWRLNQLKFPKPDDNYGRNQLNFTKEWLEREESIHQLFTQYKEIVRSNIDDTERSVKKLKEQDESMIR